MQPSCGEDLQRLSWPTLSWLCSICNSDSHGTMEAQSESDVQSAPLKGFRGYWSHMPGLRVFCFSAQAVHRAWNSLPLPSYGQCTQEVSLKTWFVSLLSLQRDAHRAACPDRCDARRSEICHWAVSAEEDGDFGPLCHLPSNGHGLCALQKASLALEPLHSQQLFSLLCPVGSFLVWMTAWRAFYYCQFQIQPMNCSYAWAKAISTQTGRNTSPVPPSAVLIGGPFNYGTEGSGSFIPFPRFAFIVKINLTLFFFI